MTNELQCSGLFSSCTILDIFTTFFLSYFFLLFYIIIGHVWLLSAYVTRQYGRRHSNRGGAGESRDARGYEKRIPKNRFPCPIIEQWLKYAYYSCTLIVIIAEIWSLQEWIVRDRDRYSSLCILCTVRVYWSTYCKYVGLKLCGIEFSFWSLCFYLTPPVGFVL